MIRRMWPVLVMLQLSGCGGELPQSPRNLVSAPAASNSLAVTRSPPKTAAPTSPTISLVGEKFCVTGGSYITEHQGHFYPTVETACDYSQQRVIISCPGGCMAAQRIQYSIMPFPVAVMYSHCTNKQPRFEPGNYNVDPKTGAYIVFLSGFSSKHYETANPNVCKDIGQVVLLSFLVKRVSDGVATPLRMNLTMLP